MDPTTRRSFQYPRQSHLVDGTLQMEWRRLKTQNAYLHLDRIVHRIMHRIFRQRYYENSRYFKKNGPILIMIGGEWAISKGFLEAGLMYELATTYNAIMYYTEHRYYGKSKPTE